MRQLFPAVSEAISRVVPLERLRWVTFGHVEADECGAMNEFLAAAPHAQVAHNTLGCLVSLNDLADRPPVPMDDGEVLDSGRAGGALRPGVGVRRPAERAGGPAPLRPRGHQSVRVIRMPMVPRSPRRSRLPSRVSTPSSPYFCRSRVR
ncbi:hypothetical protein ACFVXG_14550 [Kitasatospora sp. NPDC058162]|uniref:hypothetical protein n=1 Tax=Kitasatospora sp. NPDC058162 TaxID=3346362 RepID=UPI0036DD93A1